MNIAISYDSIINVLYNEISKVLKEIYKNTINGKIDEFKSDFLASVKIILNNLNFSSSKIRLIVNELCLDLVRNKNLVKSKELDDLKFNFWRLSLIQNMEKEIKSICDCGFFFWFRDLFQEFCNCYYKHLGSLSNFYFLSFAISDTSEPLFNVLHLEDNTQLMKKYKSDTVKLISEELFLKIARDIENDLRLHVHSVLISNLNINNNNLLKNSDFSEVLKMRNIKIFEESLNLRLYVQEYLNKMFYDMTTINLNDWKTYQQMRSLAKSKYGLYLHNVDIPSQTLEQGVDILYILRNISYFVQNYYYNLHSQIFIEVTKENNYLTVIGMQQILNSLNTHGIGIVNSIVNKIYQFLLSKLKIICNVINDEYIKSSLVIEKRFWIENKEDYLNFYPYERSEHLMNDIKQQYGKKEILQLLIS